MFSLSSLPAASERYTWFAIGAFTICAAYTTHLQLSALRSRCATPSEPGNAGVDRATEDAIKLETLEVLARGVNFDLRNAALKIITERATSEKNIEYMLRQVESKNPETRLRALKAMKCLSPSGSLHHFCIPSTFAALITSLRHTLHNNPAPPSPEYLAQRESLSILARLMTYSSGRILAIEAGIMEWLKEYDVPGFSGAIGRLLMQDEEYDAALRLTMEEVLEAARHSDAQQGRTAGDLPPLHEMSLQDMLEESGLGGIIEYQ